MKHKLERCTPIPSALLTLVFYMTSLVQKTLHFSARSNLQCLPSAQASILLCPCPAARVDPCCFTAVSGTIQRKQKLLCVSWPWHVPTCTLGSLYLGCRGQFYRVTWAESPGSPKGCSPTIFEYWIIPWN